MSDWMGSEFRLIYDESVIDRWGRVREFFNGHDAIALTQWVYSARIVLNIRGAAALTPV